MKQKLSITIRFIAVLLITSVLAGALPLLPARSARAFTPLQVAVPNHTKKDDAFSMNEMIKAGVKAVMNSALREMSKKFNAELEEKLGIKNVQQYNQALMDVKFTIDGFADQFGDDSVKVNSTGQRAANIMLLAADAANDFAGLTGGQSNTLGARESQSNVLSPAEKQAALQKRIVRAASLFASSVVCGGINKKTLNNMAQYMTGASLGYSLSDLNPTRPLEFYQGLAGYGAPEAVPEYWVENFRSTAQQKEAQAKSSAAQEILSPGLKSPQRRQADGRILTDGSLNLISVGQENAQAALFNIPLFASDSTYDTSSLSGFVGGVINIGIQQGVEALLGYFGLGDSIATQASKAVTSLAAPFVTKFALSVFDQTSADIFKGTSIGESKGCKKLPTETPVRAPVYTGSAVSATPPPPVLPSISFVADQTSIISGTTVTLSWDGSAFGAGTTFTLSGGGISQGVTTVGSRLVTPTQTTTYRITATTASGSTFSEVTVSVISGGTQALRLDFQQPTIESDRQVKVIWDARPAVTASDEVLISPLSSIPLPLNGEMCYAPSATDISNGNIPFTMIATINGVTNSTSGNVSVTAPGARTFDFSLNGTTLQWNVAGYPNSNILLNDSSVGESGFIDVQSGDYRLTVEDANGCSVLNEQTITVP